MVFNGSDHVLRDLDNLFERTEELLIVMDSASE